MGGFGGPSPWPAPFPPAMMLYNVNSEENDEVSVRGDQEDAESSCQRRTQRAAEVRVVTTGNRRARDNSHQLLDAGERTTMTEANEALPCDMEGRGKTHTNHKTQTRVRGLKPQETFVTRCHT